MQNELIGLKMHKLDDFKSFFSFGIASIIVPLSYILRAQIDNDDAVGGSSAIEVVLENETLFSIGIAILFVFGLSVSR